VVDIINVSFAVDELDKILDDEDHVLFGKYADLGRDV